MNTDPQSIFDYIFGLTVPGVKLELSRVQEFMRSIGTPYDSYPVIHIAGTNGKGSTAAMLAAIIDAYGKRTGLFTSPHLVKPNERVRVGNQLVPDAFIVEKVESWRSEIDRLGITFFEVLTALGMAYFKDKKVDIAVIETGLGGRLDATNVVDPTISVITHVSMDHENILGDNLAQIAGEKAGIIKAGRPVVLGKNPSTVRDVILKKCQLEQARYADVSELVSIESVETHELVQHVRINFSGTLIEVDLPLLGLHQTENFANVLVVLNELGLPLNAELIQKGLNQMVWQGRMQVLQKDPLVLYDVAHNLSGLGRLLDSLQAASHEDSILVVAFNARKNIAPMLKMLESWKGPVLYSTFSGHSTVERDALVDLGVRTDQVITSLTAAYQQALAMRKTGDQTICFLGSHYMAEDLFPMFRVEA